MSNTLANIIIAISCLAFGYLLGSVQNGIIIGKVFFKKDPRDYGSHNSGGTNSGRLFGKKIGIIVIILDMLKLVMAFWSCWLILRFSGLRNVVELWNGGTLYVFLAALGASIGHCWPLYYNFKGGKTVACFMASNGGVSWFMFIVCFVSFFGVFLKKKIVSLSSIISSIIISATQWILAIIAMTTKWSGFEILSWTFGMGGLPGFHFFGWEAATVSTLIAIILIIRHIPNIKRLKKGEENPINY